MPAFQFRVNGAPKTVTLDDPDTPLLYVLRNELDLTGTKFCCGLAQCGACTVHLDGRAVRSCSTTVIAAHGKNVTTIEGLGSAEKPDPLQAAFIAEQATQCGYCTAGIVMTARALLAQKPKATEKEVREALAGNLCRCGSHDRVVKAVMRVAGAR